MNDGVESGSSTTEWRALIAGVALPIINPFLTKYLGQGLTETQVVAVIGLVAGYIGARTWRKSAGAKAGLADAAAAQDLLTQAKELPAGDPKRGSLLEAAAASLGK